MTIPRSASLRARLRGQYTVPVNDGAGLLEGKDTFTQHFPVTPISLEAAQALDELLELLADINQDNMVGALPVTILQRLDELLTRYGQQP